MRGPEYFRDCVISYQHCPQTPRTPSEGPVCTHDYYTALHRLFGTVSLCNKLQTQNIVMLESPYPLPYEQVHAGQDTARPNFGSTHQFTRLYSSSSFDPTRSRRHQ